MDSTKLRHLEGLRGLAALVVLFAHLKYTFRPTLSEDVLAYLEDQLGYVLARVIHSPLNAVVNGELAVYVFWFMSAYVISLKPFRGGDTIALLRSVTKRYFRLMIPALASSLIAYFLLARGWMFHLEVAELMGPNGGWHRQFYGFDPDFWLAVRSGLWDAFFDFSFYRTYNPSLWTMKVELYGSFLCFALLGLTRGHRMRWIIYLALVIWTVLSAKFPLLSFLLGFFLSDYDNSRGATPAPPRSKAFDVSFILLFILAIAWGGRPNFYGVVYVLLCAALTVSVLRSDFLKRLLGSRPMVWLGRISFGLYLLHLPIIFSLSSYFYLEVGSYQRWGLYLTVFSTIPLSLIAAYFFTRWVDEPSIRGLNRLTRKYISKPEVSS
ncbi:MAG: acyltransferase [Bacteroidota bacterium]